MLFLRLRKLLVVLIFALSAARGFSQNIPFCLLENNNRYHLLIQDSLIGREFMLFSRVIGATGSVPKDDLTNSGIRGSKLLEKVIRVQKINGDSIIFKLMNYGLTEYTKVSSSLPHESESANRARFKAVKTGTAFEIDITSLINENNDLFFWNKSLLGKFNIPGYDKTKMLIKEVSNTGTSIEIKAKIFLDQNSAVDIISSVVLLSKEPMRSRWRIFPINYYVQMIGSGIDDSTLPRGDALVRWGIEPKQTDISKYVKGELVDPLKPIVYLVDPATPKSIIPYIKRGVNNWNKVFEKIGFKNVLSVEEVDSPIIDSSLMYSSKYSMIYYVESGIADASYSTIIDPRSGEIIQSPVIFSTGFIKKVSKTYFAFTSSIDERARTSHFDDNLLGALIERVISHEIGHCLGFKHNHIASNAVKSAQLRSQKYLMKNGCSPSIMDYARYNYVAQPSDGVSTDKAFMWGIGAYDDWAIKVGYSYFEPTVSDENIARKILGWKKSNGSKLIYRSSNREGQDPEDPRDVTESLGDDLVYSSEMGIRNIKLINKESLHWINAGENEEFLPGCYGELVSQYHILTSNVAVGVLGSIEINAGENSHKYKMISERQQRKSVDFLDSNCFRYPNWLFEEGMGKLFSKNADSVMAFVQKVAINQIISVPKLEQASLCRNGLKITARILKSLRKRIWSELYSGAYISDERKKSQGYYLSALNSVKEELSATNNVRNKSSLIDTLNVELQGILYDLIIAEKTYSQNQSVIKYIQESKLELSEALSQK